MYIPASFREQCTENLHELMQRHPLGLLVTHGGSGLQASPVPFLFYPDEGEFGVLRAHMARANPHWKELGGPAECLVVFQGAEGYVTPSWYPSKSKTHKVVPTWNYATVQASGVASVVDDAAWLRRQLNDLTAYHEKPRLQPWSVEDAPDDYVVAQMKAIIGIEIPVRRLEGKFKMSQNRDADDRAGVISGLLDGDDPHGDALLARFVERA
ncbi:MAG: FMN-binding negative transcriptional regulator [Betaproteobacteria bacterium]